MRRIRWRWLPLVLLLSPVVYLIGWLGANWWLEPKPRYSISFKPETGAQGAYAVGEYLKVFLPRGASTPTGFRYGIYRLTDGWHLNEHVFLVDPDASQIATSLKRLPVEPYRYDLYQVDGKSSEKYLLHDQQTGMVYDYMDNTSGPYVACMLNSPKTHCITSRRFSEALPLVLFACMVTASPSPLACCLGFFPLTSFPSSYWNDAVLLSVITVPDKRVVVPCIFNPYRAIRSHIHNSTVIRALSPSGRWLIVGDDSDRFYDDKLKRHWTNLHLYDTVGRKWLEKIASFDSLVQDITYFADELLILHVADENTPRKMVYVHMPSGKVLDTTPRQSLDKFRVCREGNQHDVSYVKKVTTEPKGSELTCCLVSQPGEQSVVGTKQLSFRPDEYSACRGCQVYYQGNPRTTIPSWLASYLPEGKLRTTLQEWFNRNRTFIYDFRSNQTLKSWPQNRRGFVSDDGTVLVMNEFDDKYVLLSAEVYDLPLPVWSPWWSRGTGIGLVLLFSLLLVRRKGARLHTTPTQQK